MPELKVKVRGQDRLVSVDQKSKRVWIAVGAGINGERIEAEGRTESAAANAWQRKAGYHNN